MKLNKQQQTIIGIVVLIAVAAAVVIYFLTGGKNHVSTQVTTPLGTCEESEDTFKVADNFMVPTHKEGDEVDVTYGYYPCHPVERDQLVIYKKSQLSDPVMRIVRGVPGDEYKLIKTKENTWQIEINGDLLEVNGEPYHFGSNNPPVLSLSEKATHGVLGPTHVLIFSMVPPGYDDSGVVGVISIVDLIGKVK